MKISQERYCHTAIDIDTPESHCPAGTVACAEGNLVSLVYSSCRKEDTELFYVSRQIGIGKTVAIVVTQGVQGPMLTDRILQILQIVPHNRSFRIIKMLAGAN